VLVIIAHPDDETMFNLGRFKERGWFVGVALVTNGESGSVVQGIKTDYDPAKDQDILIETSPGAGSWTRKPPDGRRLQEIANPLQLAVQRREEFLASQSAHRVSIVFFLSSLLGSEFEDSWDHGIRNWNLDSLAQRLRVVVRRTRPDLIVTLNTDETWGHPQHFGLGRAVHQWLEQGVFDRPGHLRPSLYGIREHGWYRESAVPEDGDLRFDRRAWSPGLQLTYAEHWRRATSFYLSQSSHPIWFEARAGVKILPGYHGVDILRRLDQVHARDSLDRLFARFPPERKKATQLPRVPQVFNFR
jgi:LmbE family N-acetylglucosaminyl deacetylase